MSGGLRARPERLGPGPLGAVEDGGAGVGVTSAVVVVGADGAGGKVGVVAGVVGDGGAGGDGGSGGSGFGSTGFGSTLGGEIGRI